MVQFFRGTIQTLQNMIQQEREQKALEQSPQYAAAVFNLTQKMQQQARLQAIRQRLTTEDLTPQQMAQLGAEYMAGEGDFAPAVSIANAETAADATRFKVLVDQTEKEQKRRDEYSNRALNANKSFELTADQYRRIQETGGLDPEDVANLRLRPGATLDPFTRALQATLGAAAGKAKVGLEGVKAITGDVLDVINQFQKIPSQFKGPVAGRSLGQGAKLGQSDVVSYEDTKELTLSNIAKQLGGEVGVLTDRDISRISRSLPSITDTDEAANNKIRFVLNYIDRRIKAKERVAGMEPVGLNLAPEWYDEKIDPDKMTVRQYTVPVKGDTTAVVNPAADDTSITGSSIEDDYLNSVLGGGK